VRRVATQAKSIDIGLDQFDVVVPKFEKELTVSVGDTAYNHRRFIDGIQSHKNLVHIARLQCNRVLYHKAEPKQLKITNRRERGHEQWYGEKFKLNDTTTHCLPDKTISVPYKTRKGKQYTATLECWNDMLIKYKDGIPMHNYPFTLVKTTILDEKNRQIYKNPM